MDKKMTLAMAVTAGVQAALEAKGVKDTETRDKIFDQHFAGAPHKTAEGKQKIADFLNLLGSEKGFTEAPEGVSMKDLSEGTTTAGGFLVPNEFYTALIERQYKIPGIRRYATVIPMSTDTLELAAEDTTVSVNWTTELATITQSDPAFAQVVLNAQNLMGLTRMSRQLLDDNKINANLVDWIIGRFAVAMGLAEDTAFMVGTGSGQPKGIRTYTITNTVAQAGASLADSDIQNLIYTLPRQYRANAAFIMHDSRKKLISNLRSTDGRQLNDGIDDKDNPTLKSYPVIIQDDIPTNLGGGTNESAIYFGDVSKYLIGDRQQVFSETSTVEGTSFEKHRLAVKVGERVDGKLSLVEAFAVLTAVK